MVHVSQWVKEEVHKQENYLKNQYLSKIQTLQKSHDELTDENESLRKALSNFVGQERVDSYIQSLAYSPSEDLAFR